MKISSKRYNNKKKQRRIGEIKDWDIEGNRIKNMLSPTRILTSRYL